MMRWLIVGVLLLSGCLSFGRNVDTTVDRARNDCEAIGGEWTRLGCVERQVLAS